MFRAFQFDLVKSIQTVAYLLRREPHRCMNYMRLLKVLYIAEREVLCESGKPLTGSPVVAMKRGPVLEDIFGLMRGAHSQIAQWSPYFNTRDYYIELRKDPGSSRLSKFVVNKLEDVAQRFESCDEWDLQAGGFEGGVAEILSASFKGRRAIRAIAELFQR